MNANHFDLVAVYDADSVRARNNFVEIHDRPPYNQRDRWVYALETVNLMGVTSGLSQS